MSLRPVAGVIALDEVGRVLMVHRQDDRTWCLPGGGVKDGETWAQAALRECEEETGWTLRLTRLFGIYSEPETQLHVYPDGWRCQFVGVVFTAETVRRVGIHDPEVLETGFFDVHRLPTPVFPPDQPVLDDLASGAPGPFLR